MPKPWQPLNVLIAADGQRKAKRLQDHLAQRLDDMVEHIRANLSREMRPQRGLDNAEDFRPASLRCPSRGSRSTF